MARVDYSEGAEAYRRARTPPAAVLAAWQRAVLALDLPRPRRVLDLGAGTGAWLGPLANWFGAPVTAVEPSSAMRAARPTDHHPYVAACAEALPFATGTFDVAWLSTVVHQFDDLDAVAAGLQAIIRPGGSVLVRGFFSDLDATGLLASFPGIDRAASTFPSTGAIGDRFERAGFVRDRVVDVVEPWRFAVTDWVDKVRSMRHTDSALRPLTDAEVDEGLRRVTEAHGPADGPVDSPITLRLVVLRRS